MAANARLKSLFLVPAALICCALVLVAIFGILSGGHDRLAWGGVLIANAVLPVLLAWLEFGRVPRTSEYLPFLLLTSGAGLVLVAWEVYAEGVAHWSLLVAAAAGVALLALYVFWFSRFTRQPSDTLVVGRKLPAFDLRGADGAVFRSVELQGSPAVLVFYRGNWCPLCVAQLRELASRHEDLTALGAKVMLVSPQEPAHARRMADLLGIPFQFLVDEGNRLASDFGIALRNGVPRGLPGGHGPDTVMPTVVVVNAGGTIVYVDQTDNYRVRPEPDMYLAILRRAGAIAR
ncbi:MAG TPA: peroxiredoxin-like family protein [Woeseiaceae bacterium]|nr:peroxiredoxin-like family protein [Woeseiaceae bacterium]